MSFTSSVRNSANDHSKWTHQAVQPSSDIKNSTSDSLIPTTQLSQDTYQNGEQSDSTSTHTQAKKALNHRRSLHVHLDPALCQRLEQDSANSTSHQQQKDTSVTTFENNTAMRINETKSQVNKLKSSLRQVVSAPTSPNIGGSGKRDGGKSVKFDRFHLEQVCLFHGSHSPNQVPQSDGIKPLPFKMVYSQWPPIQHMLFQHNQHVQLKRSLKILDGGSTLHGQVLVRNLGYEKQVEIRYTLDGWQTVNNSIAQYQHSRASLDIFEYDIPMEQGMTDRGYLRATVDLAVRYTVMISNHDNDNNNNIHSRHHQHGVEETFWDNNNGHNYQVQVVDLSEANQTLANSALVQGTAHDPLLSSESRYNFGESLVKAKHKAKPRTNSTDNIYHLSTLDDQMTPPLETQSASSSPKTNFMNSNGNKSLASSSYSDLVKKYCFYGSQDTSSPSPALSING